LSSANTKKEIIIDIRFDGTYLDPDIFLRRFDKVDEICFFYVLLYY